MKNFAPGRSASVGGTTILAQIDAALLLGKETRFTDTQRLDLYRATLIATRDALLSSPVPRPVPAREGKAWTPEDDAQLLHLADEGAMAPRIAREMGRSRGAVRSRLKRLRRVAATLDLNDSILAKHGKRWTKEDEDALVHQWVRHGKTLESIASELGRTPGAILARLSLRTDADILWLCQENVSRGGQYGQQQIRANEAC